MLRKYKNRIIPKGLAVIRGELVVRLFHQGQEYFKSIGDPAAPGVWEMALAHLHAKREEIRAGKLGIGPVAQRVTFREASKVYMRLHGERKKSARNYQLHCTRLCEFIGDRWLDTLTYKDVEAFRAHRKTTVSVTTVNKEHTTLTNLFNVLRRAAARGEIRPLKLPTENPGSLVRRETGEENLRTRRRVLSIEEYERLKLAADPELARIIEAAVTTLLRKKDLRLLTTANYFPENGGTFMGIQAKTGKPYCIPEVGNWTGEFDFSNFRNRWYEACATANIKDLEFKDLRRTGATWLLKKGMDMATISQRLGHSSIVMTERYIGVVRSDQQKASRILKGLFGGITHVQTTQPVITSPAAAV